MIKIMEDREFNFTNLSIVDRFTTVNAEFSFNPATISLFCVTLTCKG